MKNVKFEMRYIWKYHERKEDCLVPAMLQQLLTKLRPNSEVTLDFDALLAVDLFPLASS